MAVTKRKKTSAAGRSLTRNATNKRKTQGRAKKKRKL